MSMTISILLKRIFVTLFFLGSVIYSARPLNALPASISQVPKDSFLVFSVEIEAILNKSKMRKSPVWAPIIDVLSLSTPQLKSLLLEGEHYGFNFGIPVQFFARATPSKKNPLSFGLVSSV